MAYIWVQMDCSPYAALYSDVMQGMCSGTGVSEFCDPGGDVDEAKNQFDGVRCFFGTTRPIAKPVSANEITVKQELDEFGDLVPPKPPPLSHWHNEIRR